MAHAYVRYLGDLSGGQMMGRSVAKTYDAGEAGTNFYNFKDVADVNGRKNAYRAVLTALPLTPKEQDEVVQRGDRGVRLREADVRGPGQGLPHGVNA